MHTSPNFAAMLHLTPYAIHAGLGLLVVLAAVLTTGTGAVSSRDCIWRLRHYAQLTDIDPGCAARGFCGTVPTESAISFFDRLSPRCATALEAYRSTWSKAGVSNLISRQGNVGCKAGAGSVSGPSQPILVSMNDTAPFVMCTVPKAGCTNFRKLLYNMLMHPSPPLTDALAQFQTVHVVSYPGLALYNVSADVTAGTAAADSLLRTARRLTAGGELWQPEQDVDPALNLTQVFAAAVASPVGDNKMEPEDSELEDSREVEEEEGAGAAALPPPWRLPAHVPSFTFGRNPYVRLLSGFRNKMVDNPQRMDQHTVGNVNSHLRQAHSRRWPDTAPGFQEFVRALFEAGVALVDGHFRPASAMCGGDRDLRYDFYLRLEEMAEWFPCWMDGLGLQEWTKTGWSDTSQGLMYIGRGAVDKFVTLKSYQTQGPTPAWNANTGGATWGEKGVDWDVVSGDRCWWAPKGMTCEEYYASFTAMDGSVVPGGVREAAPPREGSGVAAGRRRDRHDTDSQNSWRQYYNQETADMAFLMYSRDFEVFGYERAVIGEV